jgi:hypothetical protein
LSCVVLFSGCGEDNPVSSNKPNLEKCEKYRSELVFITPSNTYSNYIFEYGSFKPYNETFRNNVLDYGIDTLKVTLNEYFGGPEIILYENNDYGLKAIEVDNGYYMEHKFYQTIILDGENFYFELKYKIEKFKNTYGQNEYKNELKYFITFYDLTDDKKELKRRILDKYFKENNYRINIHFNAKSCIQ